MVKCKVKQTMQLVTEFLQGEYCSVCRRYFFQIKEKLAAIQEGAGKLSDLEIISQLAERVMALCQCEQGRPMAQAVLRHLQEGMAEFLVHIKNHVCPAGQCKKLILAPCQAACPAGLDIPNYVTLVGQKKFAEALALIRQDVPLPGSLGRICEHPCERACRRATVDKAIAICALKRVAYDASKEQVPAIPVRKYTERVAVIGAGPAGLAAAYFLTTRGYGVTIFEAMPEPGGMLAYGIPPYRLPRQVLRQEIARIEAMGVEIRVNSPVKGKAGISELINEGYGAVFLGTGAWQGTIPVAGAEKYQGVYDGITFLREVNQDLLSETTPMNLKGKKVVVVGGGNVAIDAARVSKRLGAAEVRLVYRRTREEMPALLEEIVDAEQEGILFDFLITPINVGGNNLQVAYLGCLKNELSEPDASGRRKPVPLQGSEYNLPADLIIFATGQQAEVSCLTAQGIEVNRNRIVVDPLTLATNLPGVFAGGDAVTGPASAIKAMAAGKQAAAAIAAYLRGEQAEEVIRYPLKRQSMPPLPVTAEQKAQTSQVQLHDLYMADMQSSFGEIMRVVSQADAAAEAARCLRCDMCIACGQCVENCQQQVGAAALQLGYVMAGQQSTDFLRPAARCIGCGTCAVNCPTGAISQEDQGGFREMRMCGSLMSRLRLVTCQNCGHPYITEKHFSFIAAKNRAGYCAEHPTQQLCPECSRLVWSKNIYGQRIV